MSIEQHIIDYSSDLEKGNCADHITLHTGIISDQHLNSISVDGDLVRLGNQLYKRSEWIKAFTGDGYEVNSGKSKFANPFPLGLASFAFSTLVLSLINIQVRGVTNNSVLVGACLFFGGFIELIAGLLCYPLGNTHGLTAFGGFGGFWISYGCIIADPFHVISSYGNDKEMLNNALGLFFIGWTIFTFLIVMCTLKSSWGLFLLFVFLDLTYMMSAIGNFTNNTAVLKLGGYFGIIASTCGWYSLYAGVSDGTNTYLPMKAYMMPNAPTA